MSLIPNHHKKPHGHSDRTQLSSPLLDPTSHKPSHSKLEPSITSMQPPVRNNRSTNHPGLVDLPRPRKTTTEVAAKKQTKMDAAATKAKAREAKVAQVARVEREIRLAQQEGAQGLGLVGRRGRVKKTFECEEVSPS